MRASCRTTRPRRAGAASRPRPGSTRPSSSSPTTPASTSCRRGTWCRRRPASLDLKAWVEAHRARIVKLADGRLNIPAAMPHMEGHNTWVRQRARLDPRLADRRCGAARPPAARSTCAERHRHLRRRERPTDPGAGALRAPADLMSVAWPISLRRPDRADGCLGRDGHGLLCRRADAAGDGAGRLDVHRDQPLRGPRCKRRSGGAGSRLPLRDAGPLSAAHVTGLPGVFEAHVPPHHADMRAAVEAIVARKYGPAGRSIRATVGPYKENAMVRAAAAGSTPRRSRS
jgi:hypothetical protein